jgi:hypothetical protein
LNKNRSPSVKRPNHEKDGQRRPQIADASLRLVQGRYETWFSEDQPRDLPRLRRPLVRQIPAPPPPGLEKQELKG